MFYVNKIKIISPELEHYFTPLSLACLIMETSKFIDGKVILYTKFQSEDDINILVNFLKKNFCLSCSASICGGGNPFYRISIFKESLPNLYSIVSPFNIPGLYNKIGLSLPIVRYTNVEENHSKIYKENKNKSGIYRWVNNKTGSFYIGCSKNLANRLLCYLSNKYLISLKRRSIIKNALLKYGYAEFTLEILEYCDISELIDREQYYLNLYLPDYNIIKTPVSSLGYRHSEETLANDNKQKYTDEDKKRLQLHMRNLNIKLNKKNKGIKVEIYDFNTNLNHSYDSIRDAANVLNLNLKTLITKEKNEQKRGVILPYKGRFVITIFRGELNNSYHLERVRLAKKKHRVRFK